MKSSGEVINALWGLVISNEPSEEILRGCEQFISKFLSPKKKQFKLISALRWHYFRRINAWQSTDKLPLTRGAIQEVVRRAHHTCYTWKQTLEQIPVCLKLTDLDWYVEQNGEYMPILIRDSFAPDCVLELVRCGCGKSQFSGCCSCKEKVCHLQKVVYVILIIVKI